MFSSEANAGPRPMTTAQRRELQRMYEAGVQAANWRPPDRIQAHYWLGECVRRDPSNLVYVEALLNNLRGLAAQGRPSWWRRWRIRRAFRRAARRQDWPAVLQWGPAMLAAGPFQPATLHALAAACAALRYDEAERKYLAFAVERHPEHDELREQFAEALARGGRFAEADQARGEFADRQIETPRHDPTDVTAVRRRARTLLDQQRWDEAEALLREAMAASGGHWELLEVLEDGQIAHARSQLQIAEDRAALSPGEASEETVEAVRETLQRVELQVYSARRQRRPHDRLIQFELARRLHEAGNIRQAAELLEPLRADPALRRRALVSLGECRQRLRQFEAALACYREAISACEAGELRELALYRGGVLAAAMGHVAEARAWLAELVEQDNRYKDAATRLDKLPPIGDKR